MAESQRLTTYIPEKGRKFNQLSRRGWSTDAVDETVYHPFVTRRAANKANGNPAAAYFNDAIQFVKACKEQGISVLGIEGFKIFGQHIQPFQEHGLDFDDVIEDSHETIIKFLEEREDTELWFEIVSDDR